MTNSSFIEGPAGKLEVVVDQPSTQETMINVVMVMCHPHPLYQGSMTNKVVVSCSKAMQALGVPVVRFNFRGVGQSEGQYGEGQGEIADCLAVIDWVLERYPGAALWLGGFSFGGYVAYCAAQQRPVKQLLTLAPGITRFDMAHVEEPAVPWVVIQSDADEVIEPEQVFDWLRQHTCSYTLVKLSGASHFFHGRLVELKTIIKQIYSGRLAYA